MINILYDYQIFSYAVYGGVARYFYELANRINEYQDFNVKILAGFHMNKYIKEMNKELVVGAYIPRFPKTKGLIRVYFNKNFSEFWLKKNSIEVLHQTLHTVPLQSQKNRSKKVITIYDMITEKFSNLPGAKEISEMKKIAILNADSIICISKRTRDDLLNLVDVPEKKVKVVYLGCSLEDNILTNIFQANRNDEYLGLIKRKSPFLLYVGERQNYKNFFRFLEAYCMSKKIHSKFNLVCFGAGDIKKNEWDILSKYNVSRQKILHLKGDDELLTLLYKEATALVYPSLYEGFGLPVLEAMTLGCPVICSNSSSLPEVGGKAVQYFDPNEVEDIIDSMETTIYSRDKLSKLQKLGYKESKKFNWDITAKETAKIYAQ